MAESVCGDRRRFVQTRLITIINHKIQWSKARVRTGQRRDTGREGKRELVNRVNVTNERVEKLSNIHTFISISLIRTRITNEQLPPQTSIKTKKATDSLIKTCNQKTVPECCADELR